MLAMFSGVGIVLAASHLLLAAPSEAEVAPIPASAPDDAIMDKAMVRDVRDWVAMAFLGQLDKDAAARIPIKVIRQDHSVLHFGQSCIDTPIHIGDQTFEHGLGTHATSEIAMAIPKGAKAFEARVGIDNNLDTQGSRGSVTFGILIDGKETFRTPVLRGGDQPAPVHVDIPEGAEELLLNVDPTPDGLGYDQADWADACFVMGNGSRRWLDENQRPTLLEQAGLPFSYRLAGKPGRDALQFAAHTTTLVPGKRVDEISWTEPNCALNVKAVVTTYDDYPAVEWYLLLENNGESNDTPISEDLQAADVVLRTGYLRTPAILHHLEGDACADSSFLPKAESIDVGKSFHLAPTGGRSSSISAFPFFNTAYGNEGVITAVGWTGQWLAQWDRTPNGPTRFRAGMEQTHFKLHPGEQVRTPRILFMPWRGDRMAAHNRFRRLLMFQYVPKRDGKPVKMPTAFQTFDRYNARPGWATEAGQIEAAALAHKLGFNTYWLDAAWFPGNFPNGVGNWFCKPAELPNGLKPVSDVCHKNGMRFVLWFEPERVAPGTQIANEHSEFVLGGKDGGLFDLGNPDARRWLTELLSKRIEEYGLDVYRNDFNMDPLSFWRKNDEPERQGISEIRYIKGLYAMWDELIERHPGLLIDNCSSGGRRIDLEMCSRSVPLWRSDTNCSPNHSDWSQAQTLGMSLYVPLHTACAWKPTRYETRSSTTTGLLCQFAYLENEFDAEQAARCIAEALRVQPYWYGDFYPLTPSTIAPDAFTAFQFHRADLQAGVVMAFRRAECNYAGLILGLQAMDPDAKYRVEYIDEAGATTTQTRSG
ncbi:MAG: alpha-galactosidase, partial [Candidatus Hydrogenedentes bacterium]|nr:alpha-galactosidase [Candidatus Hydrogenedentota bacterium]